MPTQIRFQRGDFQSLIATRQFSLGKTGLTVSRGSQVLFDGSLAEYGGVQHAAPELIGAYKAGWLVLEAEYDEHALVARPSANIQVRHATNGGNPMQLGQPQRAVLSTTEQDEREVSSVRSFRATTADRAANRGRVATQVGGNIESQDGVAVRTLKTASGEKAKQTRTTLTGSSAGEALRMAKSAGMIDPGQGVTEDEYLDRLSPEEREEYLASKEARKQSLMDTPMTPGAVAPSAVVAPRIAKRATEVREGITITSSSGSGHEPVDLSGARKTVVAEGMTFHTTGNLQVEQPSARADRPAVIVKPAGEDVRRRIAKSICPDFPDLYDFTQPLKKKIARLHADFDDRPDVLRAVFAAEGDEVKALLVEEFPEVFGG